MTDSLPLIVLLAFATGLAAWFAYRAAKASEDSVRDKARLEGLEMIKAERDRTVEELERERAEARAAVSELAELKGAAQAREQAFISMRAELEKTFQAMATQALDANQQRFLAAANETFEKHKLAAQGGVKEVLAPAQEALTKLSAQVDAFEKSRLQDRSALGQQIVEISKTLSETKDATGKLAGALRQSPKARGRWGEHSLRNALELGGLAPKIDFEEQTTVDGESGKLRPDVVIKMPGGRSVVVDSKVALSAFLDATSAPDEAARELLLTKHAAELRAHVRALAAKEYWKHLPDAATVDFVIMFVPVDSIMHEAYDRDQTLQDDAFAAKVIIASPTSMVALARIIAFGWRQEASAKNAQQIADLGRELYRRLAKMGEHIAGVGDAIGKSVRSYNDLVGSMESRVLPQARKFKELGAGDAGAEPPLLAPVEVAPRLMAPQAELELPAPSPSRKKSAN